MALSLTNPPTNPVPADLLLFSFFPAPEDKDGLSKQVFLRNDAPGPAVAASVTVVAYHEVMPFGDMDFSLRNPHRVGPQDRVTGALNGPGADLGVGSLSPCTAINVLCQYRAR